MNIILSTTVVAVTAIICATVAICTGSVGVGDWLAIVGAFGGGAAGVHVTAAGKGAGGGP